MKILIAPDSFKGSIEAIEFCHIAKEAILQTDGSAGVDILPLADGGEGTVDAVLSLPGVSKITLKTVDALNREIIAAYAFFDDSKTAVIDMAASAGLYLLSEDERDVFQANTFGVGQIILHAVEHGATSIILGLGGSATNDGGAGCLSALGYRFLDKNNQSLPATNAALEKLTKIVGPEQNPLSDVELLVACDITNPLCGEKGATYVFGPQKGAQPQDLPLLDSNLQNFARVAKQSLDKEINEVEGAGAAGGMGAGMLIAGGKLSSGFQIIADLLGLEEKLKENQYDMVITGEGELNSQSQYGKVPVSVARLAAKYNIPTIAVCGAVSVSAEDIKQLKLAAAFSICHKPLKLTEAMENGPAMLKHTIQQIVQTVQINCQ